jgi:hypothetical protein
MTPSSLMTSEDLAEKQSSTSHTCTSPDKQASGSGSLPLTGTVHGPSRLSSTAGETMRSPRWSHPRSSCDQPINLLVTYTHITYWTLSMETADYSSQEVARLKSENDTLRARLLVLEAEVERLRNKLISAWGSC